MKMDLELIKRVLASPTEEITENLLDDDDTVFWVDWRGEDELIVEDCESILQTGALSADVENIDTAPGWEMYINCKDKRVKVPLVEDTQDRHITLCSLNQILNPDYEVRFCADTDGSDTLAFLPLASSVWAELEAEFGESVQKRFHKIQAEERLF